MSVMSGTENVDLLSRLPSELMQDIFDRFEDRDRALVAPISKRLVPFQQLRLYRTVSLKSYDQLDKFCSTAKISPAALKHVVECKIDVKLKSEKEEDSNSSLDEEERGEEDDPFLPTSEEVKVLLRALDNVTILDVRGSSRLAQLVLTPEVSLSSFPKLITLRILSALSHCDDPFHPAFYSNLQNYTTLQDLFLTVYRKADTIQVSEKPLPEHFPSSSRVSSITLNGPLSSSPDSVKALLGSFEYLSDVDLRDSSPSSQLYDLLDALDSPEDVGLLWLTRYSFDGPPPRGSISSSLAKFESLNCLLLGGSCAPLSPDFYSSLRKLPLRTLSFQLEADVNLDELTRLISGPQKHDSLEKISFDNVEGKKGTTSEEMDYKVYTGPGSGGFGPYPDWELPEWTDSFKPENLKNFLKVAEKEGIEVEGSALEALKVDVEFEGELDFLYFFDED